MDVNFIDLRATAIIVLFKTKWECYAVHKSNNFVVKEALTSFVSILEDDDVGYFYDPKNPLDICTNPGELVGKIANSDLPYEFNFSQAINRFVSILDAIDNNDYNKIALVVSDCLEQKDAEELTKQLTEIKDARIHIFTIGRCATTKEMVNLDSALDLKERLEELRISFRD